MIARRIYSLAIYCALPFAFAMLLWRGLRDRGYWQGLSERLGWGDGSTAPAIWLHAVSLGEMSAAAPLIRALRSRHPQIPLIVTTATPTGRARAQAELGGGAGISFLPYDTPGAVKRFLSRIRPRVAIILETELWPNLFAECERRGVPVLLASARLSARSVSRYRRCGRLFTDIFSGKVSIAAQTAEDAERFKAIGATAARTHVVGNVKFDIGVDPGQLAAGESLRSMLGNSRPAWIAGSTHAGEESQVLEAHRLLQTDLPNALLLLAPRHPKRFDSVAALAQSRGLDVARRSGGSVPGAETQVLLVDTVGELAALYAAADVAFVGGSLVPVGGHNLLEPAALGLPVLTGPYNGNGNDVATLLLERGAALQVADAQELGAALRRLFADPQQRGQMGSVGREIIESNRGSVARLLELIDPLLAAAHP